MYTFRSLLGGVVYDLPSGVVVSLGFELSDIAGITVKYPVDGINADKVIEDATLIAYWNGVEIKNGRWWLVGSTGETLADGSNLKTISGRSLFRIFEKVVVHTLAGKDKLTFDATAGSILNTLFTDAQARGAMTGVTWDFGAVNDSDGVAWTTTYKIEYSITDDYLKVIQGMVDNGWIELEWVGTQIRAYKPLTLGDDKTATVTLIAGRDYEELPYKTSIEDRAHYALVAGDEAARSGYAAPSATGPYGREEVGATQGGVKATTTLDALAYAVVQDTNKQTIELTRKLVIQPGLTPVPGFDFNVGDYITEQQGPNRVGYRVRAMALGLDRDGLVASIVLNDRIFPQEVRAARRAKAATSGSVRSKGATGVPAPVPAPAPTDTTVPSPPTSVGATSGVYLDPQGNTKAFIDLTWVAPTTNVGGSSLTDLAGYEVQWRRNVTGALWTTIIAVDPAVTIAGLDYLTSYQFRVRAYDTATSPNRSSWSATLTVLTANDTIAPSVPSTPIISVSRSAVTVSWNGKTASNGAMEADFSHVEVHRSLVNAFTTDSTTLLDRLYGAGSIVAEDQAYDTPYYYKFRAVDKVGNPSASSAQASANATRLVGGDLANLTIAAGNLMSNSVETDKLAFGAATGEKIAFGVLRRNLIADGSFEDAYTFTMWDPAGTGQGEMNQWRKDGAASTPVRSVAEGRSRAGRSALLLAAAAGGTNRAISNTFATVVGQEYRLVIHAVSLTSTANMDVSVVTAATQAGITTTGLETLNADSTWADPLVVADPIDPELYESFSYTWTATNTWAAVRIANLATVAASTLVVDDVSAVPVGVGGASQLTAAGLVLFDNDGFEATSLVTNRPNYYTIMDKGIAKGTWNNEGDLSARKVSVDGVDTNADGVSDSGFEIFGTEFNEHIWNLPWGTKAWSQHVGGSFTTSITSGTEVGLYELAYDMVEGRQYEFSMSPLLMLISSYTAGAVTGIRLRATTDGSIPNLSSPVIAYDYVHPTLNSNISTHANKVVNGTAGQTFLRVLVCIYASNCTATVNTATNVVSTIKDIGPVIGSSGVVRNLTSGTPATAAPKTFTKTYTSTGAKCYMGNGSQDSSQGTADMKQGYSSADGDSKSLWLFPSMTTDLAGSTISKIRVYLYANHWYYNSGGTAYIKVHGASTAPASWPPVSLAAATTSSSWPKPGGRWVTLPSSLHAGFLNGTYKGIGVGPAGSNNLLYYGRFNRDGAKIEVTYVK